MTAELPADAITAAGADLFPLDRLALHMAKEQIMRGENPPMNTTATLVAALERITAALPALTAAITAQATTADDEEDGYEPFIAAEGWREETSIRYVPESRVAEAAAQAAAAEREAIIARLRRLDILWGRRGWLANAADLIELHPDHGLLGGTADGAHTPGGAT